MTKLYVAGLTLSTLLMSGPELHAEALPCAADMASLCTNVPEGDPKGYVKCLHKNIEKVSPACRANLESERGTKKQAEAIFADGTASTAPAADAPVAEADALNWWKDKTRGELPENTGKGCHHQFKEVCKTKEDPSLRGEARRSRVALCLVKHVNEFTPRCRWTLSHRVSNWVKEGLVKDPLAPAATVQ